MKTFSHSLTFLRSRLAIFCAAFLLSLAGSAPAALLNYSEAVSGDLPGSLPGTVFTIDTPGLNVVSGIMETTAPSQNDSFTINLAAGLQIDHVRVQYTDVAPVTDQWQVQSAGGGLTFAHQVTTGGSADITDTGFNSQNPTLPVLSGQGAIGISFVGSFIATNPGSWKITFTVSTTPAQVAVPNVVGLTQAAGTTAITGAGLVLGTVTTASSGTVAVGLVISESPAAGTLVNVGSAVNIVVSSGPAQVAVPNVVGLTQAAGTTAITGAGLVLGTVTTASSGTVAVGLVISESPAAGTLVNVGSAVNIVVSTGSPPVVTGTPVSQLIIAGNNASFVAAATGNPAPTVQWQVSTDLGATFGNLTNGGVYSNVATTTLNITGVPFGLNNNQYRALFNNGVGSPVPSTAATLTVNRPPVCNPVALSRYPTQGSKLTAAQILAQVTDPDGDAVTVTGVSGGTNAAVSLLGGFVFYTPNAGNTIADSFTYTVTDARGATASGTVNVSIVVDNAPSQNITKLTVQGNTVTIDFAGIPGFTYGLQYTPTLSPATWVTLGPVTTNSVGAGHVVDSPSQGTGGSGFYRLVYP